MARLILINPRPSFHIDESRLSLTAIARTSHVRHKADSTSNQCQRKAAPRAKLIYINHVSTLASLAPIRRASRR